MNRDHGSSNNLKSYTYYNKNSNEIKKELKDHNNIKDTYLETSVTVDSDNLSITSKTDGSKSNIDNHLTKFVASWSDQHELILIEWADKAACYKWMHTKSYNSYAFKNTWFTIPVIIFSTLTGTANFANNRIPENYQNLYSIIVGSINIFAGILTTIQQFLKISEHKEAHRISSISWDKFYRNIKLELAKSREERMVPYQMLKISKEEFDRLIETSPSISGYIIKKFNKDLSGTSKRKFIDYDAKQRNFEEIYKPEICGGFRSTKNFVYKDSNNYKENNLVYNDVSNNLENNVNNIINANNSNNININDRRHVEVEIED